MNSSRDTTASSTICSPLCRARPTSPPARIGMPRVIINVRSAKSLILPSTRCGGTCSCISLSIEDSNVLSARRCSTGPEISAPTCKRFTKCDLKSSSSKTTSSPSQKRSFWRPPPPEINKSKRNTLCLAPRRLYS